MQKLTNHTRVRSSDLNEDGELATIIAAAKLIAIDKEVQKQEKMNKSKSRMENSKGGGSSRAWTGDETKDNKRSLSQKKSENDASAAPKFKRIPTFADAYMGNTNHAKGVDVKPIPIISPRVDTIEIAEDVGRKGPSQVPGGNVSKADAWMNAQMSSIESRYEKVKSTIQSWEERKKAKALRRLHKTEGELEGKRAKSLKNYRDDILRIYRIASRATESAERKRINEEFKAKEKAEKMKTTGKAPATPFCF